MDSIVDFGRFKLCCCKPALVNGRVQNADARGRNKDLPPACAMKKSSNVWLAFALSFAWVDQFAFTGFRSCLHTTSVPGRSHTVRLYAVKGYFAIRDLLVVERKEEDVAAFHESERKRWRKVYDEEYVETPQDFYPGDRVEVIADVSVNKDIRSAEGMRGVVTHFDFDDGYESCQTCQSSYPVTVLLDEIPE